jgi:Flp pilus assembly pilin Flp
MKVLKDMLGRFSPAQQQAETLEYALIAFLIVATALVVLATMGPRVLQRWQELSALFM